MFCCWRCSNAFLIFKLWHFITYSHFELIQQQRYLVANPYQHSTTKSFHPNINPMAFHRLKRMIYSSHIQSDVLCIYMFVESLKEIDERKNIKYVFYGNIRSVF